MDGVEAQIAPLLDLKISQKIPIRNYGAVGDQQISRGESTQGVVKLGGEGDQRSICIDDVSCIQSQILIRLENCKKLPIASEYDAARAQKISIGYNGVAISRFRALSDEIFLGGEESASASYQGFRNSHITGDIC